MEYLNDFTSPVGVLDDIDETIDGRKIFDCGNERFISNFELLIAWNYINNKHFYEECTPKFYILTILREFTDMAFRLREIDQKRPTLELIVSKLEKLYDGNFPMLGEVNRVAELLGNMHPSKKEIARFETEFHYWDKFIFLLQTRNSLQDIFNFSKFEIEETFNNIKTNAKYVF